MFMPTKYKQSAVKTRLTYNEESARQLATPIYYTDVCAPYNYCLIDNHRHLNEENSSTPSLHSSTSIMCHTTHKGSDKRNKEQSSNERNSKTGVENEESLYNKRQIEKHSKVCTSAINENSSAVHDLLNSKKSDIHISNASSSSNSSDNLNTFLSADSNFRKFHHEKPTEFTHKSHEGSINNRNHSFSFCQSSKRKSTDEYIPLKLPKLDINPPVIHTPRLENPPCIDLISDDDTIEGGSLSSMDIREVIAEQPDPERLMPHLSPLGSDTSAHENDVKTVKEVSIEVIDLPSSPEMPILIPITERLQECEKDSSSENHRNEKSSSYNHISFDSKLQPKVVLERISLEGCLDHQNRVKLSELQNSGLSTPLKKSLCDPQVDVIDNLTFFSFASQQEMNDYSKERNWHMLLEIKKEKLYNIPTSSALPSKPIESSFTKDWQSRYSTSNSNFSNVFEDDFEDIQTLNGNQNLLYDKLDNYVGNEGKITPSESLNRAIIVNEDRNTCKGTGEMIREGTSQSTYNKQNGDLFGDKIIKNTIESQVVFRNVPPPIISEVKKANIDPLSSESSVEAGVFTSTILDEYLEKHSKLNVELLEKLYPNIIPIPPTAPILSLGKLRKIDTEASLSPKKNRNLKIRRESKQELKVDIIQEKNDTPKIIHNQEKKVSPYLVTNSEKKVSELNNSKELSLTKDKSKCNAERLVLRLRKESTGITEEYKVAAVDKNYKNEEVVPVVKFSNKELITTTSTVFLESDKEQKLLNEFLKNLNLCGTNRNCVTIFNSNRKSFTIPDTSNKEIQSIVPFMNLFQNDLPKSNNSANTATVAASLVLKSAKKFSKTKTYNLKSDSKTNCVQSLIVDKVKDCISSQVSRNKRSTRLPRRFLDSALLAVGSEWVSPVIDNNEKVGLKRSKKQVTSMTEVVTNNIVDNVDMNQSSQNEISIVNNYKNDDSSALNNKISENSMSHKEEFNTSDTNNSTSVQNPLISPLKYDISTHKILGKKRISKNPVCVCNNVTRAMGFDSDLLRLTCSCMSSILANFDSNIADITRITAKNYTKENAPIEHTTTIHDGQVRISTNTVMSEYNKDLKKSVAKNPIHDELDLHNYAANPQKESVLKIQGTAKTLSNLNKLSETSPVSLIKQRFSISKTETNKKTQCLNSKKRTDSIKDDDNVETQENNSVVNNHVERLNPPLFESDEGTFNSTVENIIPHYMLQQSDKFVSSDGILENLPTSISPKNSENMLISPSILKSSLTTQITNNLHSSQTLPNNFDLTQKCKFSRVTTSTPKNLSGKTHVYYAITAPDGTKKIVKSPNMSLDYKHQLLNDTPTLTLALTESIKQMQKDSSKKSNSILLKSVQQDGKTNHQLLTSPLGNSLHTIPPPNVSVSLNGTFVSNSENVLVNPSQSNLTQSGNISNVKSLIKKPSWYKLEKSSNQIKSIIPDGESEISVIDVETVENNCDNPILQEFLDVDDGNSSSSSSYSSDDEDNYDEINLNKYNKNILCDTDVKNTRRLQEKYRREHMKSQVIELKKVLGLSGLNYTKTGMKAVIDTAIKTVKQLQTQNAYLNVTEYNELHLRANQQRKYKALAMELPPKLRKLHASRLLTELRKACRNLGTREFPAPPSLLEMNPKLWHFCKQPLEGSKVTVCPPSTSSTAPKEQPEIEIIKPPTPEPPICIELSDSDEEKPSETSVPLEIKSNDGIQVVSIFSNVTNSTNVSQSGFRKILPCTSKETQNLIANKASNTANVIRSGYLPVTVNVSSSSFKTPSGYATIGKDGNLRSFTCRPFANWTTLKNMSNNPQKSVSLIMKNPTNRVNLSGEILDLRALDCSNLDYQEPNQASRNTLPELAKLCTVVKPLESVNTTSDTNQGTKTNVSLLANSDDPLPLECETAIKDMTQQTDIPSETTTMKLDLLNTWTDPATEDPDDPRLIIDIPEEIEDAKSCTVNDSVKTGSGGTIVSSSPFTTESESPIKIADVVSLNNSPKTDHGS